MVITVFLVLVLIYSAVSRGLEQTVITAPIVFTGAGHRLISNIWKAALGNVALPVNRQRIRMKNLTKKLVSLYARGKPEARL